MRKYAKDHRVTKEPNLAIYSMTQTKIKDQIEREIEEEKEKKELAERMKPVNITTVRYNSKIADTGNKTIKFSATDKKTSNAMSTFS